MDWVLKRHTSGPVSRVSGYVEACYALDAEVIAAEYSERAANAPTRSSGYLVEHDTSKRKPDSPRDEELLAHRLFVMQTTFSFQDWYPITIVDYQTPLNAVRRDGLGKVDLLGSGSGLCVIELKVEGGDTPLSALLEAVGYCAVLTNRKMTIENELQSRGHPVLRGPMSVLILAPGDYWEYWDRRRSKADWRAALTVAASTVGQATGIAIGFGSFVVDEIGPSITVESVLD